MVQEIKAYKASDGRMFYQREEAIRHDLVSPLKEELRKKGCADDIASSTADCFFDILTENDGRIAALLKMYRDCHPQVKGLTPVHARPAEATASTAIVDDSWRRTEGSRRPGTHH